MTKNNISVYYCLLYTTIGDIIGFDNGNQKTNKDYYGIMTKKDNPYDYIELSSETCNHMIFEFINKGLLSGLRLIYNKESKIVSSNTILHLAVANGLTEKYNTLDEIITNIKNNIITSYENDKLKQERYYSNIIIKQIQNLKKKNYNYKNEKYNKNQYSSDVATRCMIIGVIFSNEKDLNKLLYININSNRLTHNNGISILGGICSALFCSFAVNSITITTWIFKLIKILESKNFKNIYLENTNSEKEYLIDLELYIYQWKKYIDFRFTDKKEIKIYRHLINPSIKYQEYFTKFSNNKEIFYPGDSGDDCMIIAYDCFLDIKSKFIQEDSPNPNAYDQLVCYSMLNTGNSNNIGSIASCLYGLTYFYKNIYSLIGNNIEIREKINNITEKFKKIL